MRLKTLIWLAAQAVKAELFGGEGYEYQELALLVGVTTKNWSKTFTGHWVAMNTFFIGWMVKLYCWWREHVQNKRRHFHSKVLQK
ncbi:Q antiterminator encoded by prophage CP-933P [Escherichia coli]|nr:Q antiterminator encoded by prophage CP-933P [Escherichia coli]